MRKLLRAMLGLTLVALIAAAPPPAPSPAPLPPPAIIDENVLVLDLSTGGRVTIAMRPDIAPAHVERIRTLVRQGFYNNTVFHRVIAGFMAQGGDPTATGTGGSQLPNLKAEFNDLPHVRGAVAMARAGSSDSANSQFYICLAPALKLDRTYTVWGRVLTGMEFVDAIEKGEPPANPSRILKASIATDKVQPPMAQPVMPPQAAPPPALLPGLPPPAAPPTR